jgi:uncharacterized RDD family membrane protein YckC
MERIASSEPRRTGRPQQAPPLQAEAELPRAGFWVRGGAAIIDLILLAIPFSVFVSLLSVGMGISNAFLDLRPGVAPLEVLARFGPSFLFASLCFFALLGWVYFAGMESSRWRATCGKRLMGIYVGDLSGRRVDFWRASLRFAGGRLLMHVPYVGSYYFLVDCLWVGVTPGKRAVHDLVSGCVVLRENVDQTFVL